MEKSIIILAKIWIKSAKSPFPLGVRQKCKIPSCCLWKVVTFFGKEQVNWSSIREVLIGRSWKIKSNQPILIFSNSIFQLLSIITPLLLDQLTCSLPKKVTTFHRQQDGVTHFCLSPNKSSVLALWIHISTKKITDFSKRNCSTSFKLPKHPFYSDRDKNEWFHLVVYEK